MKILLLVHKPKNNRYKGLLVNLAYHLRLHDKCSKQLPVILMKDPMAGSQAHGTRVCNAATAIVVVWDRMAFGGEVNGQQSGRIPTQLERVPTRDFVQPAVKPLIVVLCGPSSGPLIPVGTYN